ncbi:RHS repeat domain-containing protein [uncultured Brevibacillus sp.]|uniref:RHS repeat domain-containing protein n=1 Tax=uncultured Brevibacillus sp. TaxID=169970 RepID=UPI002595432A|nr:RHS repeat domain-containing protein [uncultured Brevibacillus sp.]
MREKISVLVLILLILAVFSMPEGMTTAAQDPIDEISQMDQEILGLHQTLEFFQAVAIRKGNEKLANQILQQASAYFERAKDMHKQQPTTDEQLLAQKEQIRNLQAEYDRAVAGYWAELLPELGPKLAESNQQAKGKASQNAALLAIDPAIDPFEPNDDFATSYPITSGNYYESKLSTSTDKDVYRFDSGALTGTLTVTLTVPKTKDYDLLVTEGPSTVVDISATEQLGGEETVSFQVKPNTTYYMTVFSFNKHFSTTDTYWLRLDKVTKTLSPASPIDVSLPLGEAPAYKFTAPVTGTYRFYTGPYGGFGATTDTALFLFSDEQLSKLLEFNDDATDGSLFSEMKVDLTAGVSYYVYLTSADKTKGVHARLTAALDTKATVASATIREQAANDGTITDKQVITLAAGTFATDAAASVTVNNLPAGLQPIVTRTSSQQLTVQFGGKALSHESKHSVQNVTITIPKAKVAGVVADLVTNPFAISFTDTESLYVTTTQDINLAAGVKKIVKLTAPATGSFDIFTSYYGGNSAEGTSNTWLGVYEDYAQTQLLAANDDGGQPPFSKVTLPLQKGQDYYVVLTGGSNNSVHARLSARYLGVEYVYNAKGQLVQIKQNGTILTEFTYDGNGNLIKKQVHQ